MKQEKGIALIFTLIMLSLLLILALAFALDSMFDQKAAYNSASASAADSLAQSQLQEILCLVRHDAANFSKVTWSRDSDILGDNSAYTSAMSDAYTSAIHTDMLSDSTTSLLKVTGLLDEDNNASAFADVNWNYIRDTADNNRFVGRTAFVIIPDEKIPLPSLIDGRAGTTEYPKHNETNDTETRVGKYVSEINVRHAIPEVTANNGGIATIADVLNWEDDGGSIGFTNGEYTGSNWSSFDALFDLITTAPNAVSLSNENKDEFQNNLTIASSQEGEAFWADTNDNDKINANELYRRFNLARTDWDKTTSAEDLEFMREQILMLQKDDTSEVPVHAMQAWDNSDGTTATQGLPWLALFGYQTDGTVDTSLNGTFDSVYKRRCQIAANLKDYCDDDGGAIRPTSDVDPATWVSGVAVPNFTGNEKTPYIDKFGIAVYVERMNSGGSPSTDACIYYTVEPSVGLVNIYDSTSAANLYVKIKGSVTITATGPYGSESSTYSIDDDIDFTTWSSPGYSPFKPGLKATPSTNLVTCAVGESLTAKIEVKIDKLVLYEGSTGYDYVQLANAETTISPLSGNTTYYYGWAAHDPRQNLNTGDWLFTAVETSNPADILSLSGSGPYTGLANAAHATYPTDTPDTIGTTDADKETGLTDPVNVSTAFIRNGPMQSPWELGFIHRGKAWQTVSLKKYVTSKAYKTVSVNSHNYIPGGGLYDDGDANILDQIKMTDEATGPQKINLNSPLDVTFHALLSKIQYGCASNISDPDMTVASIAGGGTELSPPIYPPDGTSFVEKITNAITVKYKETSNPEERKTRASVVDKLLLPASYDASITITANTDAAQEELIGKVVNLTKIGSQAGHFTIVVVAQSIKDVGGVGVNIPMTKYSVDGSTPTTKNDCRVSSFDAAINANPDQSVYFDEITATRKIIFRGQTLGANKIKVIGIEHAD